MNLVDIRDRLREAAADHEALVAPHDRGDITEEEYNQAWIAHHEAWTEYVNLCRESTEPHGAAAGCL